MSRLTAALALPALALATALAGCGQTGELQRPPPLFGKAKAAPATTADQSSDQQDASQPVRTIDPRSNSLDPRPPRVNPLLGQSPDPLGSAPQGAMGNPYADPR
jgi:predicted small lipoprotein YifL